MAPSKDPLVQDVSAWVLRAGVALSVATMLLGLVLGLARHAPTVAAMTGAEGPVSYGVAEILRGLAGGDGTAFIQLGVLLLVLTPVTRVALSAVVFAVHERDRLYAVLTAAVLALTLASLLLLR